jgi:hypothetical protein
MTVANTPCVCGGYGCLNLLDRNIPCPFCTRVITYDPLSTQHRCVVEEQQGEPVSHSEVVRGGWAA